MVAMMIMAMCPVITSPIQISGHNTGSGLHTGADKILSGSGEFLIVDLVKID